MLLANERECFVKKCSLSSFYKAILKVDLS
nr:MAG TPA: hypothetical protein [Caudoviricetes sp.]